MIGIHFLKLALISQMSIKKYEISEFSAVQILFYLYFLHLKVIKINLYPFSVVENWTVLLLFFKAKHLSVVDFWINPGLC